MKSKVILQADCEFKDKELRELFLKLETRFQTINERTKRQTIQIRELEKKLNKLKWQSIAQIVDAH